MKNFERMSKKELIEELREKEKTDMSQFKQFMEKIEILNTQLAHRSLELELAQRTGSLQLRRIAANLRLKAPKRKVDFKIKKNLEVKGDKYLLQAVLENLIDNAWKYTGMKELAVIEFGVTEYEGKPACFVRDNGIGFDSSQAAKLFEPFRTMHRRDEFKGYGIGLATVKRIIQRHGGQVWAEGEVGKGATFYFTLG